MTKEEFEHITRMTVSNEDYQIIETVYTYHPCISDAYGKEEIASLYISFGMRLIKDMLPTAKMARTMEDNIRVCKQNYDKHIAELRSNYNDFKKGLI